MLHGPFSTRERVDDPARFKEAFRPGSVPRIEVETRRGTRRFRAAKRISGMYRRALARHRTAAALLLGLSLRAPSASAEPYFFVRGAPPANVGYFLDRVRVPHLEQVEPPLARGLGRLLPALLFLLGPEVKLNQTQHTHEPSARDRFSVLGFGSYDPLGEKSNSLLTRLGDACRPKITFTW